MDHLYFSDNAELKAGEVIAVVRNPTGKENIDLLRSFTQQCETALADEKELNALALSHHKNRKMVLGEMQSEYARLIRSMNELQQLLADKHLETEIGTLSSQIKNNDHLAQITEKQLKLMRQVLANSIERFEADSIFYAEGFHQRPSSMIAAAS